MFSTLNESRAHRALARSMGGWFHAMPSSGVATGKTVLSLAPAGVPRSESVSSDMSAPGFVSPSKKASNASTLSSNRQPSKSSNFSDCNRPFWYLPFHLDLRLCDAASPSALSPPTPNGLSPSHSVLRALRHPSFIAPASDSTPASPI
mgnify:CR=1 FL=1